MTAPRVPGWKRYLHRLIAAEISTMSRYYDRVVQIHPLSFDTGDVLDLVACGTKSRVAAGEPAPDCTDERDARTMLLVDGVFNHHLDIQGLLAALRPRLARTSRVVAVSYNPYWSGVYRLANRLGWRSADAPTTFLTRTDLGHLAALSGFEVVRVRPVAYVPVHLLGLGTLVNRILPAIPVLRWAAYASVITLRPRLPEPAAPSLTVVIPARNERGNIAAAVERMPVPDGCRVEVIFVEGNSTDGTWEEIQRVCADPASSRRFTVRAMQQTGRGKNDAVRVGFGAATGDVLTILDADLTMPPEMLGRFYEAYRSGVADVVNGSRLVYPMEGEAMRPLNRLGNVFFAKALSHVLDLRLGDSLCGTKLLSRHDYRRIVAWRKDFGDFDPFGDFELLFPAAVLGLGTVDMPVAYRARTYGETNISRFRHGLLLLRMTLIGLLRISTGRGPR